jgi:hypothetical protein
LLLLLLQADSDGGALQLCMVLGSNYSLTLSDCAFTNNTSNGGVGGSIAVDGQGVMFRNVSFQNNMVSDPWGVCVACH